MGGIPKEEVKFYGCQNIESKQYSELSKSNKFLTKSLRIDGDGKITGKLEKFQ